MKDQIRQYLQQRGCPAHVQEAGLAGLIESWETVVTEVSHGYDLTLDDYRNDMDGRQLIEELMPFAKSASHKALLRKLSRLDAIMRTLVVSRETSIWGNAAAQEKGWTRERNWWYFSQPQKPGPDLRSDLEK